MTVNFMGIAGALGPLPGTFAETVTASVGHRRHRPPATSSTSSIIASSRWCIASASDTASRSAWPSPWTTMPCATCSRSSASARPRNATGSKRWKTARCSITRACSRARSARWPASWRCCAAISVCPSRASRSSAASIPSSLAPHHHRPLGAEPAPRRRRGPRRALLGSGGVCGDPHRPAGYRRLSPSPARRRTTGPRAIGLAPLTRPRGLYAGEAVDVRIVSCSTSRRRGRLGGARRPRRTAFVRARCRRSERGRGWAIPHGWAVLSKGARWCSAAP